MKALQKFGRVKIRERLLFTLALVLTFFSEAAVRGEFGPVISVSGGTLDSNPDVAFNETSATWLVVWKQSNTQFPGAGTTMCRLMNGSGTVLTSPTALSGFRASMSAPKVAYDPFRNEFLVVWSAGSDPIEPSIPERVEARRVSATGGAIGSDSELVSDNTRQSLNPAVAAGRWPTHAGPNSYYLLVWEDEDPGTKIHHILAREGVVDDNNAFLPIALPFPAFVLDSQLPVTSYQSFHPTISRRAP